MEPNLREFLSGNWTLLLFVIIALGYLIAKIRLFGVPLRSTAGVLIAGLLFGHLGFPDAPGGATFGFTLFIFSVGLGAVTGAMTSTPALGVISEAAKSPVPSLGYAGTYTFANVFLTFSGTLMITLL